jgi:hypothetical protein
MAVDLSSLPIKSLQLATKTVAKLEPLAVKTIAELYSAPLARLIEAGLSLAELEELVEAAPNFGVSWQTKEQAQAALSSAKTAAPEPKSAPAPKTAKPKATEKEPSKSPRGRGAKPLPADVGEAFSTPASEPLGLSSADLESLASKLRGPKSDHLPSPRHPELL